MRAGALMAGGAALVAGAVAFSVLRDEASEGEPRRAGPAAVDVAPVTRGAITRRRDFGGALEPSSRVVLAARAPGRLEALEADLGDRVKKGEVVARVDDDELAELARAARAELRLAAARAKEAKSAARLSAQTLARLDELEGRGVVSDVRLETARSEVQATEAAAEVAEAERDRARAALEAARVRLGYASLEAEWRGPPDALFVAERHAREGDALREADPVLTLIGLDPLLVVIAAAEADYRFLKRGLRAEVRVDAYPDRVFEAEVARFPPSFDPGTRQVRVELEADNEAGLLAPGMFAEVSLALSTVENATIVPHAALTRRDEQPGVFLVEDDRVRWVEVEPGLREGGRLQIVRPALEGEVVTLGQRLLDDGSAIIIPDAVDGNGHRPPAAGPEDAGGAPSR